MSGHGRSYMETKRKVGGTGNDLAINFYYPDRVYYRGSSKHRPGIKKTMGKN